ncbi:MAG: putative glycoside hydrolase, partial [Psychromonas sp.]
ANYDLNEGDDRPAYNYKLHGSKYLLNDILKEKMGFDGLIVTDWNGQQEIDGCSASNCAEAVNAGNDVFMVTARDDWKAFYQNVIDQVSDGTIKMSRIDDAVTRILRVKMRANLWEKPQPSMRLNAGNEELLGADSHRAIAREAVSKSLVLLKNEGDILPLSKDASYIIAGSAADSIQKQTGGWSLTWQGDGNTIDDDFPGANTLQMALESEVGAENVYNSASAAPQDAIAIVVIGEDPYAEMFGDIKDHQTLEFSTIKSSYKADLEIVQAMKDAGHKVITVFYSGRPLYVNEEINASDAFIAAWLPGTEAGGITDVLFNNNGMDFTGRLSYSWPKLKCSTTINRHAPNIADYTTPVNSMTGELIEQDIEGEHKPLFPYAYGLSYGENSAEIASESDLNTLPLDPREYGCGLSEPDTGIATTPLEIFGAKQGGEYQARIAGDANGWTAVDVDRGAETTIGTLTTTPINYQHQQDAVKLEFSGDSNAEIFLGTIDGKGSDRFAYTNADATLQFDVQMLSAAPETMILAIDCGYPCRGDVDIWRVLPEVRQGDALAEWDTVKVPLACFAEEGTNFQSVDKAFLLQSQDAAALNLGNIRYVPRSLDAAEDAVTCESLRGEALPPLTDSSYDVLADFSATLDINEQYDTAPEGWWNDKTLPEGATHLSASIDMDTVNVSYNQASPESYKGHAKLIFAEQNLSEFTGNGALVFELYVESLGSQKPEGDQTGLVMKVGNSNGDTGDILVEALDGANIVIGDSVTV